MFATSMVNTVYSTRETNCHKPAKFVLKFEWSARSCYLTFIFIDRTSIIVSARLLFILIGTYLSIDQYVPKRLAHGSSGSFTQTTDRRECCCTTNPCKFLINSKSVKSSRT